MSTLYLKLLDIDECEDGKNGGCSHTCVNSLGSFSCNCPTLHYLASNAFSCIYFGPPTTPPISPSITPQATHPRLPSQATPTTTPPHQATPSFATTQPATSEREIEDTGVTGVATPTTEEMITTASLPTEYQCGGSVTTDVGSLHSENWPQTYPINVDCDWTITLPNQNLVLELTFHANPFGLAGKMPNCRKDWVKAYSMDTNGSVVTTWGPFCGYNIPPSILTKTSVAKVQFHSGLKHGSSRKGFRVGYQALEVCMPLPPPVNVQGQSKMALATLGPRLHWL